MVGSVADNVGVLFDSQIIMRKFLIAIPLMFMCCLSQAQNLGAEEIIEKINIATSQMESMECSFVQTKHIALLSDKMVSKGKMFYSQPDKLRWEYVTPYTYTFILNENQVLLKNSNRSDVIDVEKNKMFKGIPFGFHFIRFWQFVLPTRVFDFFFGKVFGLYNAMDNFTGRKPLSNATAKA